MSPLRRAGGIDDRAAVIFSIGPFRDIDAKLLRPHAGGLGDSEEQFAAVGDHDFAVVDAAVAGVGAVEGVARWNLTSTVFVQSRGSPVSWPPVESTARNETRISAVFQGFAGSTGDDSVAGLPPVS